MEPGFGRITELSGPRVSPDGRLVACTGKRWDGLEGRAHARICLVNATGGELRQVTDGPNDDAGPRWSPDGARLTFVSDRAAPGRFQLFVLDANVIGEARPLVEVPGVVEHHEWAPDGSRVLLVVAGARAEQADALGSGTLAGEEAGASWLPEVESSDDPEEARRLWIADPATGEARIIGRDDLNVWEASWCGTSSIAAVAGAGVDEGAWYRSPLVLIDADSGADRELLSSDVQLGWAMGAADGSCVAVIEALCSDRYVVAGDLILVDTAAGEHRHVDTGGVDVSWAAWRDPRRLLAMGLDGMDAVALEVDVGAGAAKEIWHSSDACGDWYPAADPLGDDAFVAVLHATDRPPALVSVASGDERVLATTAHTGHDRIRRSIGRRERLSWTADDGLTIEGIVIRPSGAGPFPLILHVHGGPISAFTMGWPSLSTALLVDRGFAVLQPNPRGSGGRGRGFAAHVVGDMGGGDARDVLAGVDALVTAGVADPARIGVFGGSYGGFMAAWLPTQDDRFAASVSASPVTDWYSERFDSTLGSWAGDFLGGEPHEAPEAYAGRSPVMAASASTTPTLLTAGVHDRATPVGQAVEYYRALRANGVPAEVVVYPEEGHGVRTMPAIIDAVTRLVEWFERFMPPDPAAR